MSNPNKKLNTSAQILNDDKDAVSSTIEAHTLPEIKIEDASLGPFKTFKNGQIRDSVTRTRPKRKTALKAHGSITSCFKDEDVEPTLPEVVRPKRRRHIQRSVQDHGEDKPDLIDISNLCSIKKETDDDDNGLSLLKMKDYECNEDEDVAATGFLETGVKETVFGTNYTPTNKIYLKTDQILGTTYLRRPVRGPQQIGGFVDTKNSQFNIKCDLCREQFNTKSRFNSHLQKVHNIKSGNFVLQCKYCPQRSKRPLNLKYHMLMYHLDELNLKTKWYRCAKCQLTSTDENEIRSHKEESIWCHDAYILMFHTCTECPYQTDIVSKLQSHIKLHFKSGTVRCPHCTLKCHPSQLKMMNQHLLLHKP